MEIKINKSGFGDAVASATCTYVTVKTPFN